MSASIRSRNRNVKNSNENVDLQNRSKDNSDFLQSWTPSAYTAFKALMSARLCSAIWMHISDCDETFNYWEPAHFLMYGKGFQTWEYSPVYAIRSYAYLWLHVLPMTAYQKLFQSNKVLTFYFLRCFLGFCCASCEVYFYRGVCKHFGANIGRLVLSFLIFSTGLYISSTAFLPSSFTMYMTMTAFGGWFLGHYQVAIFSIAVSALLGWPFAGALGIPIALDLLVRKTMFKYFTLWSFISLLACLIPIVQVDSYFYGKLVITPLNIVIYNVFSQHGPDLYGVEPWTFYFKNGFLNFNVVFILALPCLLLVGLAQKITGHSPSCEKSIPTWLSTSAMYIWMAIFFTRPHKEERFLFPIYPLICMSAAISLDCCQKLYCYLFSKRQRHYTETSGWLAGAVLTAFAFISISRTVALYQGYHAPLDVYVHLSAIADDPKVHSLAKDKQVNVCVGKEWYRFPNSFYLPTDKWQLQFVQSEFKGQLPKPYIEGRLSTRIIPTNMNDMNEEETSRYVNISKCHYLIDLDEEHQSKLQPHYSRQTDQWSVLHTVKYMDTSRSSAFFRAFYIPFLSSRHTTYINYNLLKTKRTKNKKIVLQM